LNRQIQPALLMVHRASNIFQVQSGQAHIPFGVTFCTDASNMDEWNEPTVFVEGDRSKINQVLRTLVSNAFKSSAFHQKSSQSQWHGLSNKVNIHATVTSNH